MVFENIGIKSRIGSPTFWNCGWILLVYAVEYIRTYIVYCFLRVRGSDLDDGKKTEKEETTMFMFYQPEGFTQVRILLNWWWRRRRWWLLSMIVMRRWLFIVVSYCCGCWHRCFLWMWLRFHPSYYWHDRFAPANPPSPLSGERITHTPLFHRWKSSQSITMGLPRRPSTTSSMTTTTTFVFPFCTNRTEYLSLTNLPVLPITTAKKTVTTMTMVRTNSESWPPFKQRHERNCTGCIGWIVSHREFW